MFCNKKNTEKAGEKNLIRDSLSPQPIKKQILSIA